MAAGPRVNDTARRRRSLRLPGYDYAATGGYFVTLCTVGRACLFGEVAGGEMRLSAPGRIVREEWFKTGTVRPGVRLHPEDFVIMPNHIHGIIWIIDGVGATRRVAPTWAAGHGTHAGGPPPGSVGAIIGQFKSLAAKRINAHRGTPGVPVWQRNYYEHILRSADSLDRVRQYIADNPARWEFDPENPQAVRAEPEEPWRAASGRGDPPGRPY